MRVCTVHLHANAGTYGIGYTGESTDLEGIITKEELEEAIVYLEDVNNKIETADKSAIFRYEFESKARITVLHNSGGWRIQLQADYEKDDQGNYVTRKKLPDIISALKACKEDLDSKLGE